MSKRNKIISSLANFFCLSPLLLVIPFWNYVPDSVVIHFDVYGNPDWSANKFFAFIITPIIFLLIHHLILYIYKNHRRIFGMEKLSIHYYHVLAPAASMITFLVTLKYAIL